MNLTFWNDRQEAERKAQEWADKTGVAHLVIRREERATQPDSFFPKEFRNTTLYNVLTIAEWNRMQSSWNAAMVHIATVNPDRSEALTETSMKALIANSSLGTPGAISLRSRTPAHIRDQIVREATRRRECGCPVDTDYRTVEDQYKAEVRTICAACGETIEL